MKILKDLSYAFLFTILTGSLNLEAQQLMRFPDISGSSVVFTSGEDIWTAPLEGGNAVRLTIHDGQERYPKFSPDGNLIAFTGDYDGNSDVYVMNSNGGNITRLTYHPGFDEVVGWHPVKNKIIFRAGRNSTTRYTKLFMISPDGTGLEELILYDASRGSFSPDGRQIAYNKVSREDRTWKRYTGGLAQDIYIYNFESNEEENITNFKGTDRMPMWIGNNVYFISDRNRYLNIYAYNVESKETSQLTNFTDYDVLRPSAGKDKIVYDKGGKLWVLDINNKTSNELNIKINTDAPETRPYIQKVENNIQGFDISPSGKRAIVVARGELFSIPVSSGITQNISNNCAAREKDAVWSNNGKMIAYLSDKSGEYEIYIQNADGTEESIKLTSHKNGYRHTLRWSPDDKKIAFADQTLRCYILDVGTRQITEVDQAKYENADISLNHKPIYDYNWSPDSKFLAYSKMNKDMVYQVYIYSLETKKVIPLSNGLFSDFNPLFTKDGEHLLFISNRRFNPTYCDIEWEMVYKDVAGIYALSLKKEGESILPFKNDVEEGQDDSIKQTSVFRIDFEGIEGRIEALPLPAGNYRDLAVNETSIFYLNSEDGDYNKMDYRELGPRTLYSYSFDKQKEKTVIESINSYKISSDGSNIIYGKNNLLGIIPSDSEDSKGNKLNLSDLKMNIDPVLEWKAIFNEAWRMERDFYYEPNMHGVDWNAMKEKYSKLIDRATCRQDLQFIIGELIGELNTSHTYVYGGRGQRKADRVNIGMLGTDWTADQAIKRYQFKKIYRVPDWSRQVYAPLSKPGLNINEGDYLLAVNGEKVTTDRNIYSYFIDLAGKQVKLLVNNKASETGAREVTVEPLSSEAQLRYNYWLENNRIEVDKASNGQIGYIYMPDTYEGSGIDFPKYFYSQTKKKGLIIDGRFNGGGLDPEIFFQRLLKKPHGYWTRRYSEDQTIPFLAVNAHMACLTNRYAGSGGDELPYEFQWNKMGPVIGTRTWGGLVGVSMFIELLDGSGLTAPDYRIYNEKGDWVVENEGIEPDIVIEQNSLELSKGRDTQLMKAVEVLLKEIKEDPKSIPAHKPYPLDNHANEL
ncbi:MAG TPA: S41 family peptidase [Bacteroidales bacterium]|nr:S41 family peptidase [Bacteroidales bacterium]